ncbi:MAG: hypothetical protein KME64_00840 [Scytonematopsis contorta HA4267-MV1]|jgi:hypothetical protein|nr:hypothetical protein [Scytonematopsis contorta HA4267-MV1]
MTDYIKRIQSNLAGKKIKLGRPVIKEELELLGYSNETLTDDIFVSVINKLTLKFSNSVESSKLLPDCEPVNVLTPQFVENAHQEPATKLETELQTKPETDMTIVPEPEQEMGTEIILEKLPSPGQESESGIVVSEGEKQELVAAQSLVLDIQLSEAETIELCEKIPDVFDDYKSFVSEVISAIKAFIDEEFDYQETQTIDDSISELRQHIATRHARLDGKLSQGFSEVKGDFEQIRSNIKSRKVTIVKRCKRRAKP